MTPPLSAGILLHRRSESGQREVWIAHMGGPFWGRKEEGAWSIPKGEYTEAEDPLTVARREFAEEIGVPAPPPARLRTAGSFPPALRQGGHGIHRRVRR